MASQAVLELLVQLKDEAGKGLDAIGDSMKSLGLVAGGIALAGVTAFGAVLADGVAGAREANQVMAQTEQTIKTMGNAAGVSADHVADFASSLSDAAGKSLFGDDQVQAATNMLLTFDQIKGSTLDAATALSVDMAQALKSTPEAMSKLLGKTLNSADAMSALRKQGVSFTDEQIKLGKQLFETGHVAEYQALVMGELNKEFGGQAEAAAKAAGGMVQFKARLGEAAESMGQAVIPLLDRMGTFLNDTIAPAVEGAAAAFSAWLSDPTTVATIDSITNAIMGGLGAAFAYLSGTVLPAVVNTFQTQILPVLSVVVGWLQDQLPKAIAFVNEHWAEFQGALIAIGAALAGAAIVATLASLATTIAALASPIGLIVTAVGLLGAAWAGNWGGIRDTLTAFWAQAQPILKDLYEWLATTIPPAIKELADFWTGTLQPALAEVWAFIQKNIIPILNTLVTVYIAALKLELQALANFWTNILLPALNEVWSFLNSYIIPIISALVNVNIAILKKEIELLAGIWNNVLLPALNQVWSFIQQNIIPIFDTTDTRATGLTATIRDTLGPAFQWLGDNVLRPVVGFFNDIGRAVQDVIRWINDLANKINSIQIPDWLQGHSPPPMADWFGAIADQAQQSSLAVGEFSSQIQDAAASMRELGSISRSVGGGAGGIGSLAGGIISSGAGDLGSLSGGASGFRGGDSNTTNSTVFHPGAITINPAQGTSARQIADTVISEIDRRMRSKK